MTCDKHINAIITVWDLVTVENTSAYVMYVSQLWQCHKWF